MSEQVNRLATWMDARVPSGVKLDIEALDYYMASFNLYIESFDRGRGLATQAMKDLTFIADELGISFVIYADPADDDFSEEAMWAFYSKFGFRHPNPSSPLMVRSPR